MNRFISILRTRGGEAASSAKPRRDYFFIRSENKENSRIYHYFLIKINRGSLRLGTNGYKKFLVVVHYFFPISLLNFPPRDEN